MKRAIHRHRAARKALSRAMDVTMIATTVGCAAAANMIVPSSGSVLVGALLGVLLGLAATKKTT
ncbi:hypothetical protein [Stutzerimonas nitrititolerans]|uniref:hypothetical protein n=1 Tax=Stutzerimonas nitrititolerans TaxID=2482751 RepID=UPI00289D0EE3|nr:hypothetical protein [Stutzerimonas nitrititolerans]